VALAPAHRRAPLPEQLIRAAVELAREAGARLVRLYAPAAASWAVGRARALGFRRIRMLHVMLRPADAGPLARPSIEGVRIRPLRGGEEPALLAALNHAWAGTWNFRPISAEALARDLRGQRKGFLLAVEQSEQSRIAATCHAIFHPAGGNPDGHPYAWISNLTTAPAWCGRHLGRAMLAAGVNHLRAREARSVALGADGGDPIPLALYRSAGFGTIGTLDVGERPTDSPGAARARPELPAAPAAGRARRT
jgi:mycothiol synthase